MIESVPPGSFQGHRAHGTIFLRGRRLSVHCRANILQVCLVGVHPYINSLSLMNQKTNDTSSMADVCISGCYSIICGGVMGELGRLQELRLRVRVRVRANMNPSLPLSSTSNYLTYATLDNPP